MSEFLYYFADTNQRVMNAQVWRELVAEHELSYLAKCVPALRECHAGPEDKPGIVVAARLDGAGPAPSYKADEQVWRKRSDVLWIGMRRDAKPTPAELEQRDMLESHAVELADGNTWRMPVAVVAPHGATRLEVVLGIDENGADAEIVKPSQKRFGDLAHKFWDAFMSAEDGKVSFAVDGLVELAVAGLSLNYRVGVDELRMIGALSSDNIWKLAYAAIDGPRFDELVKELMETQKKTESLPAADG